MKVNGLDTLINEWYEKHEAELDAFMKDIWAHPELGLNTKHAAEASLAFAKSHGFPDALICRAGEGLKENTENPNAVIAEFGSGKPVIGIVGELDALPGLGNKDVPGKDPVEGPGHGCGHNLIAGAAMGAACALKYAMEKEGIKGTLRLVEAPGEEVGRGKALLAKDGVFSDMDMAIMWHPGSAPFSTEPQPGLCIIAGSFAFHGKTAHAAGAPWDGRSSLDAVQLMNMGVEFMREHITKDCIVHYQITNGGAAPNIVPDYASVKYFCRAANNEHVKDLYDRVVRCGEGAAHMTDTVFEPKLIFIIPYFYQNMPLHEYLNGIAQQIPDIEYTDEEYEFAKKLTENYTGKEAPSEKDKLIAPAKKDFCGMQERSTCTDAADMSYFCPTAHIHGGGTALASPGHHWTITACSGTSIGFKAAVRAGKVLAEGALEAFGDQELIDKCWAYHKTLNIPSYDEVYNIPIEEE
ncbi:MAG: amidohydrolase [Firmicutes bacterium]|nr:amidohydrolase [Bacillota bacterium]